MIPAPRLRRRCEGSAIGRSTWSPTHNNDVKTAMQDIEDSEQMKDTIALVKILALG